jgi:hypothetical protein
VLRKAFFFFGGEFGFCAPLGITANANIETSRQDACESPAL